MNKHNYLFLIWKDPQSRKNYTVGKLGKLDEGYSFEYCGEYEIAKNAGWTMIQSFPQIKKYESEELFPVFSSRLPDKKRRNINEILDKYGLAIYDGYELLKYSGGKLPIDTYEFIDPIFDNDKTIERDFFIVGVRYVSGCKGKNCFEGVQINVGMKLILQMEPTNLYDKYAIKLMTEKEEYVGYIPRYYSQSICNRLENGMTYDCTVIEVNRGNNCQECVKVKLMMPKNI